MSQANLDLKTCQFLTSAAQAEGFPVDELPEVAFAGRSNAGKSSALNALTNRRALARVSNTPGRTQLVNFFNVGENARLVDLPGYGYAKVAKTKRAEWGRVITEYLQTRDNLRGIIILMDVRRPLTDLDQRMVDLATRCQHPCHILLTKADKLSRGAAASSLQKLRRDLPKGVTAQLFSAPKSQGLEVATQQVTGWLTALQTGASVDE